MSAAAKRIASCTLELGGKSPIVVFEDADIEQAIDWITTGIFFNCGQVCSATSRLIIHESIKDEVVKGIVAVANSIHIGAGFEKDVKLGPLVNSTQHRKVLNYMTKSIEEGAKILCGGPNAKKDGFENGYFVHPTLFEITPNMTIWKEEVFGPVLGIITFNTE